MLNKYETIGVFASVALMAIALFLLQVDSTDSVLTDSSQSASVVTVDETNASLETSLRDAFADADTLQKMVLDDVRIGSGPEAEIGDTIAVHYVGRLKNGQEFDNSYRKGDPFTFTLGAGEVITGWDEGLAGMQVGGKRVLVVPPQLAYGDTGYGPIPPSATLIFVVELMSIDDDA